MRPELLSPAGSPEALRAAVRENGPQAREAAAAEAAETESEQ